MIISTQGMVKRNGYYVVTQPVASQTHTVEPIIYSTLSTLLYVNRPLLLHTWRLVKCQELRGITSMPTTPLSTHGGAT